MILHRAQIAFDSELQLVKELIDGLASSGLPWLTDEEYMDIEPGINDFDPSELEWLQSLSRNSRSALATRIADRFQAHKVWEGQTYPRQLQIVIRILIVVQEFGRLTEVLMLALGNNSRQDTLITLITAVASWHAPLEGMGMLPTVIDALAASVQNPFHAYLTPVAPNIHQLETLHVDDLLIRQPTHSPLLFLPHSRPTPRRLLSIPAVHPPRLSSRCFCLTPV